MAQRTLAAQTTEKVGKKVLLQGWVNGRRDHGKLVFLDLRDRSGLVQLVCSAELSDQAGDLRDEYVIEVVGKVQEREKKAANPDMRTGQVEIQVSEVKVLSEAGTPPFSVIGDGREINEELRLKYRYLDLRRPRLAENLRLRSQFVNALRQSLLRRDFVEIETPLLSKSTPEGARDFLVPSRLQPGKFYALPQSPQQYKQLLMVAGFERYFQMAKCLRDEDLRADRGFEFTQLDLEMSFVEQEDVLRLAEEVFVEVVEGLGFEILKKPFPRFTHQEAMRKFGDDKFDLRSEKEKERNIQAFAWVTEFPLFEQTEERVLAPSHHPFTAPVAEDIPLLDSEPMKVRSLQHDLVCNGFEVGGGSVRITDPQVQRKVFEILGHDPAEVEEKFGHLLEAFTYGVPPHGGVACGIGRLVACLAGEKSLREVVAFPTTSSGRTAVMDAPGEVEEEQLKELGIRPL